MKGVVLKSTGSWYKVLTDDGQLRECRVRGRLRLEGWKETNPIAVGDFVDVDLDGAEGSIVSILPRANHMIRLSVKRSAQTHVLAANLSQAMLMASMVKPRTSPGFIDRFLVTAEAYSIPQVLCFNKIDLLDKEELDAQEQLVGTYSSIGIKVIRTSVLKNELTPLREILSNKTTLLAGHSGVGKSTMLNKLSPTIHQKVGEVSDFSDKGTHVTTFAEMFTLDEQTRIIDTPGVKEWGLSQMAPEEISDNFPEMRALRAACKFGYRCLHIREPRCAVVDAVGNGTIAMTRYESYLSMVSGEDNRR